MLFAATVFVVVARASQDNGRHSTTSHLGR